MGHMVADTGVVTPNQSVYNGKRKCGWNVGMTDPKFVHGESQTAHVSTNGRQSPSRKDLMRLPLQKGADADKRIYNEPTSCPMDGVVSIYVLACLKIFLIVSTSLANAHMAMDMTQEGRNAKKAVFMGISCPYPQNRALSIMPTAT